MISESPGSTGKLAPDKPLDVKTGKEGHPVAPSQPQRLVAAAGQPEPQVPTTSLAARSSSAIQVTAGSAYVLGSDEELLESSSGSPVSICSEDEKLLDSDIEEGEIVSEREEGELSSSEESSGQECFFVPGRKTKKRPVESLDQKLAKFGLFITFDYTGLDSEARIKLFYKKFRVLRNMMNQAVKEKNAVEARALYEYAKQEHGRAHFDGAHIELNLLEASSYEAEDSVQYHKQALEILNNLRELPECLCQKGFLYLALKQYEEAIQCFKKVINMSKAPRRVVQNCTMGYIKTALEDSVDCLFKKTALAYCRIKRLDHSLNVKQKSIYTFYEVKLLIQIEGSPEKAIERLKISDVQLCLQMVDELLKLNERQKAQELLDKIDRSDSRDRRPPEQALLLFQKSKTLLNSLREQVQSTQPGELENNRSFFMFLLDLADGYCSESIRLDPVGGAYALRGHILSFYERLASNETERQSYMKERRKAYDYADELNPLRKKIAKNQPWRALDRAAQSRLEEARRKTVKRSRPAGLGQEEKEPMPDLRRFIESRKRARYEQQGQGQGKGKSRKRDLPHTR